MSPADTVAAPALDTTLLAVLSIFGGAALAAAAGLFVTWIQSRGEHERWLRDKRLDVYVENLAEINEITMETRLGLPSAPTRETWGLDMAKLGFKIQVLGGGMVTEAFQLLHEVASSRTQESREGWPDEVKAKWDGAYYAARASVLRAIRLDLGVKVSRKTKRSLRAYHATQRAES